VDKPFPAYEGDGPYVFVSYSHKDSSSVYPEITWLRDCGFNVWYDEGIEAGTEWSEELANRIEGGMLFLYFITPESAESQNCRNEVNYAVTNGIPTLAVHLKKTDLSGGLSLSLSARQAILKHAMPHQKYREKLRNRIATFLEPSSVEAPVTVKRQSNWASVAAAAILGVGILLYSQYGKEGAVNEADAFDWSSAFSIVVLPFEHITADPEIEAISKGLTDVVMQRLTQRRSCALEPVCHTLKVSKTEIGQNVAVLANEHDAHYVLHGNIQRDGQVVQIRVQLLRADNSSVWMNTYTRTLNDTDVFTLQSEVANSVAEHSAVWLGFDLLKLHALEHPALTSVKPAAREYFLKAREQALLANTGEGGDDQILLKSYLEKSIEADPEFALAYLLLSETYTYRYGGMSLGEATTGALTHIAKAIELNPTDPQNLLQAGQVHLLMTLDYREADALLRQGMDQYPDWGWFPAELAMIALREGRIPAALKLMATAEKISFGSEQANFQYNYAWLLYLTGHYELSLTESSLGLELASGGGARADLLWVRWAALVKLGRFEEARPLIDEAWKLDGIVVPESYIAAYANTNQQARARDILAGIQPGLVNQYFLATGYLSMADYDGAFKAIDAGIENHNGLMVDSLKFDELWDPIRCDPRFEQALRRLEQMETLTDAGEKSKAATKLTGSDCESGQRVSLAPDRKK